MFPYAYRKLNDPREFFQAIEDQPLLDQLEQKVIEEIKGTIANYEVTLWDGHYSIKAQSKFIQGFNERNLLLLFDKNISPLDVHLYLINANPEKIAERINTDTRDRNKKHVSKKVEDIIEHSNQEREMFYSIARFFNQIAQTLSREIYIEDGKIGDHVEILGREICKRKNVL